jgi:hypothetical protein
MGAETLYPLQPLILRASTDTRLSAEPVFFPLLKAISSRRMGDSLQPRPPTCSLAPGFLTRRVMRRAAVEWPSNPDGIASSRVILARLHHECRWNQRPPEVNAALNSLCG